MRYFLPESADLDGKTSHAAACLVFPHYRPDGATEMRRLHTGDALLKLAEAGYDFPERLNKVLVAELIDWLHDIPCYEMRFRDLDDAVESISDVLSSDLTGQT